MFSRSISFRFLTMFVGSAICLTGTFAAGWTYSGLLQSESERLAAEALRVRADLGSDQIARRMHAAWQVIARISKLVDVSSLKAANEQLDLLRKTDERWETLVVADTEGRVLYGSSKFKEASNVSKERWFRRGLTAPYIGDASTLSAVDSDTGTTSDRLIEMSIPILAGKDRVTGVVAGLVNWRWLTNQLESLATPQIDVLLVGRDRVVLYGPNALLNKKLNIGAGMASSLSTSVVLTESWPDGNEYLTVVVPSIQYRDLPDIGWSVLMRMRTDVAFAQARALMFSFWVILITASIAFIALLIVAAIWIDQPLQRLVRFATDLAEGRASGPPEIETRYEEAALLSAALVRMQSQLPPRLPAPSQTGEPPPKELRIYKAELEQFVEDQNSDQARRSNSSMPVIPSRSRR